MKIGNKTWFSPKRYKYQTKDCESWYVLNSNGIGDFYRKNGPAYILPDMIQWAKHGNCQRIDGPCHISCIADKYLWRLVSNSNVNKLSWQTEEEYWNR